MLLTVQPEHRWPYVRSQVEETKSDVQTFNFLGKVSNKVFLASGRQTVLDARVIRSCTNVNWDSRVSYTGFHIVPSNHVINEKEMDCHVENILRAEIFYRIRIEWPEGFV
jgi:hypothetical protein